MGKKFFLIIGFGILSLFLLSPLYADSLSEQIENQAILLEDLSNQLQRQAEELQKQIDLLESERKTESDYTLNLLETLQNSKDSLMQAQVQYQKLQTDYEKSQKASKIWKGLSIIFGGTTVVSFGIIALLAFIM